MSAKRPHVHNRRRARGVIRYTAYMEGNHLMTPQVRLLTAAATFAVAAALVFVAVWMWPTWFPEAPAQVEQAILTEEQQDKIREDLRASMQASAESESSLAPAEEEAIRETLTEQAATSESSLTTEEEDAIRAQLRAQMQQ